jgi:hypothetical protein
MATSQAAVFGQLGLAMLKTIEISTLEQRIEQLEQATQGKGPRVLLKVVYENSLEANNGERTQHDS